MKMKNINKNLLILLLIGAITLTFYFYNKTLEPVFLITDTQYYLNVVKRQKKSLKFSAFKNHQKLVFKEIDSLNESISDLIVDDTSLVIMSPLVAFFYLQSSESLENPYISIGCQPKDDNGVFASIDIESGWAECADDLRDKNFPLYLISDKSWSLSMERASAFSKAYGDGSITTINLNGDEMKQYALSLIDKIKKEGINNVVITGTSLIGEFVDNDSTLEYSIPESLVGVVPYNQINKVVYTDLSSLLIKGALPSEITLKQNVWDFQRGLKNYLIQFWRFLESKLF